MLLLHLVLVLLLLLIMMNLVLGLWSVVPCGSQCACGAGSKRRGRAWGALGWADRSRCGAAIDEAPAPMSGRRGVESAIAATAGDINPDSDPVPAVGEKTFGEFSCCCANDSWRWPHTSGGPVPRPHREPKCACAPGWRCAPQGYPVRFRGSRGRIHFGPGTHEPDLVRFAFRRTRTGFGSVSAPMNQIIIKTAPQSTPFALPVVRGRGPAWPEAGRGGRAQPPTRGTPCARAPAAWAPAPGRRIDTAATWHNERKWCSVWESFSGNCYAVCRPAWRLR